MNFTIIKYIARTPTLGSTVTALVSATLALLLMLCFATLPGGRLEGVLPNYISSAQPPVSWKTAATFTEIGQGGDSITQTVSFGPPVTLSSLPDVSAAAQNGACYLTPFPPSSRDLAVPFLIVSTLDSSVQDSVSVSMNIGSFSDPNYNVGGLGWVAYGGSTASALSLIELGGSIKCDLAPDWSNPQTISLSAKDDPVETDGWMVFPDAVDADHPKGNMQALGQTYAQLAFGSGQAPNISINVTGRGVCVSNSTTQGPGDFQGIFDNDPPYLHMDGPEPSWEQCTGRFKGNPMY